jgi:hypothetical protein
LPLYSYEVLFDLRNYLLSQLLLFDHEGLVLDWSGRSVQIGILKFVHGGLVVDIVDCELWVSRSGSRELEDEDAASSKDNPVEVEDFLLRP